MTLEERIRSAIKDGGLLSIALYRLTSGPQNWCATYLNDGGKTRESVEDADPIVALEKAIRPTRLPKRDVKLPIARQVKKTRRDDDIL